MGVSPRVFLGVAETVESSQLWCDVGIVLCLFSHLLIASVLNTKNLPHKVTINVHTH